MEKGRERVFQTGKVLASAAVGRWPKVLASKIYFERRTINDKTSTYLSLQFNEES